MTIHSQVGPKSNLSTLQTLENTRISLDPSWARAAARKKFYQVQRLNRTKELAESFLQTSQEFRDPLIWLQRHTQTRDPHWREAGATSPYRPFPEKPYF